MGDTTMPSISLEVVDIQGYLWLTAYFHYFTPGSLRIYTQMRQVPLYRVRELIDKESSAIETRRWMLRNESPYPGYCHAPGTNECLPVLCNCEFLTQIWLQKWHLDLHKGNGTSGKGIIYMNKRLYKKPPPLPKT